MLALADAEGGAMLGAALAAALAERLGFPLEEFIFKGV
jgi:hypothetical protein